MKTIFFILVCIFCSMVSFGQKCPLECKAPKRGIHWVKVPVIRHRTIFLDMGGASAHSTYEIMTRSFKKWYFFETRGPRIRHSDSVRVGTIKVEALSNDDTGNDHIIVYANGHVLLDKSFGSHEFFTVDFDFTSPQPIFFEVSSMGALNNSPGAFEARIWIKYDVIKYKWKRI